MSGRFQRSWALRVATAVVAIASIAVTMQRTVPQLSTDQIVVGGIVLSLAAVAVIAIRRMHKRRTLSRRMMRTPGGCKLCGLDPSVDDADEPAPRGRCIECGRVRRT
jgi:hypothetical protein